MVDYIKPQALPAAASVTNGASIPLGSGLTDVVKATPKQIVDAGRPVATEAQAVAGTMNDVTMTPLTVKQAVEANGNAWGMRARAWAESDTPPDPTDPTSKSAKTLAGESAASAADARADAETLNNAVVMKTWVLRSEADGQRVFTEDADGNPIETVGQGNRLEGPAPLGFLTPDVDYTAENDEVVLNFDSTAGDLFLFTTMPRVTSTEAQAYLNELRDETGANAAAAEAAADRAEVFGPRHFNTIQDLQDDTVLTPSNTPVGSTISVAGVGDYVVVASVGDFTTSGGIYVKKMGQVKTLSSFGGDVAKLFASQESGDTLVIDMGISYNADSALAITKDFITVKWDSSGHIDAPNLSNADDRPLISILGTQLLDRTLTSAFQEGDWTLFLDDTSGIQRDDLLVVMSNIPYNGDGTSGFDEVFYQDFARVRDVTPASVRLCKSIWFGASTGQITYVRQFRPLKGVSIINPSATGPTNGIAQGVMNGGGAKFIRANGVVDFSIFSTSGEIVGFPGHAVLCARYDNVSVDGLYINSGEKTRTTQAYYGVVTDGGRGARVSNCSGVNIRRVADTGAGAKMIAIDLHHENIDGSLCNGTAAGTHHAWNYTFENIRGTGCVSAALGIRSKNNRGRGVYALGCGAGALITPNVNSNPNIGVGYTEVQDVYDYGGNPDVVKQFSVTLNSNGEYKISGQLRDYSTFGVYCQAKHVSGLELKVDAESASSGSISITGQDTLNNVRLMECRTGGATSQDILIGGAASASTPASSISIKDCILGSVVTNNIVIGGVHNGFFEGETMEISGNYGLLGSGNDVVRIDAPSHLSASPVMHGNIKVKSNYSSSSRSGRSMPVGSYPSIASLPSGMSYLVGDYFDIIGAAADTFSQYQCVSAGTTGVLSGVTGTIPASSNTMTVSGNSDGRVCPGCFITYGSTGVTRRVVSVSSDGSVLTLSATSGSAQSGVPVSYVNPVFKGKSKIDV